MITRLCTFEFLDFWSSPVPGQPGEADQVCFRDSRGLPALDGDTVKGLFRDAVNDLESLERLPKGTTANLFGTRSTGRDQTPGTFHFSPAVLTAGDAAFALQKAPDALFRVIQQTALKDGVAQPHTLRSAEWAGPCLLACEISGPESSDLWTALEEAAFLIRAAGALRHRGYGRVCVTIATEVGTAVGSAGNSTPANAGTETNLAEGPHWLHLELLSRTLLGSSARSVGHLESLDHVPGSALLGAAIAAGGFDASFLSEVCISPAYPVDSAGRVGLPAPLCWSTYVSGTETGIISQLDAFDGSLPGKPAPMKGGYVHLHGDDAANIQVALHKPTRIYSPKSARDPEKFDRSQDAQFFALDRLEAGQKFCFMVSGKAADEIVRRLLGPGIHLGRRRNSGNGKVRISRLEKAPLLPTDATSPDGLVRLYAWSDLALYRNGQPSLEPMPDDFGLPAGSRWLPEKSAIKTRSYSAWNQFHGGFEGERHIICRGSILTFGLPAGASPDATLQTKLWEGIGAFNHEGFGKLLINPHFLNLPKLRPPSREDVTHPLVPGPEVLTPETPWQRWMASHPAPETARNLRLGVARTADRLRGLVQQQRALNAPTPTPSQFRALALRIGQASNSLSVTQVIEEFCGPLSPSAGIRGSIRSSLWTRDLLEDSRPSSLVVALLDEIDQRSATRDTLAEALLTLAAESVRQANAVSISQPARP